MKEKYDRIGKTYDKTRKADKYLLERIIGLLKPSRSGKYLDIGCGTGNYTAALNERGFDLTGVDPSREMLRRALLRPGSVCWKNGASESVPLPDQSVDGIVATLTIHHWPDLDRSFRELNRVLKAGGKMLIFTSTTLQMSGYWLNRYFPQTLNKSARQMPTFDLINDSLEANGFNIIKTERYFVRKDLQDLFLYSGKNRPRIYLDETIRQGISAFSDLAIADEVEKGLSELKQDLESGAISEVIAEYENDLGDYLFILAEKKAGGSIDPPA